MTATRVDEGSSEREGKDRIMTKPHVLSCASCRAYYGIPTTVSPLPRCDFDETHGPAAYDFRTLIGAWGYGCESCWEKYRPSARLGTGYGQKLIEEGSEPDPPAAPANLWDLPIWGRMYDADRSEG